MDHVREVALGYAQNILNSHVSVSPEADAERLIALAKVFEAYLRGWDEGRDMQVLKASKGK